MEHATRSNEVNSLEGLINFINCNQFDCNSISLQLARMIRLVVVNVKEE